MKGRVLEKEVVSVKSELDLKSSEVILNCANFEFRVQGFQAARVPLCASFSVERRKMNLISENSDLEFFGLGFGNFAAEVLSGKNDPNTPSFFRCLAQV